MAFALSEPLTPTIRVITPPRQTEDLLIICCRWFADAEISAAKFQKPGREWRWFPSLYVANIWLDRCAARGVRFNTDWVLK